MFFQKNFRLSTFGPAMNNVLSRPIEEPEWPEIPNLFEYMVEVLRKADRVGLAAPQVGCFRQFMVIKRSDRSIIGLVNPEITRLYGRETSEIERCVSLPPVGNECRVPRLETIDVETSLVHSPHVRKKLTFQGELARIVQHELDHLTGTFIVDRVSDCQRRDALDRFNSWKSMRRAQMRKVEENVDSGIVTISRGQPRMS